MPTEYIQVLQLEGEDESYAEEEEAPEYESNSFLRRIPKGIEVFRTHGYYWIVVSRFR